MSVMVDEVSSVDELPQSSQESFADWYEADCQQSGYTIDILKDVLEDIPDSDGCFDILRSIVCEGPIQCGNVVNDTSSCSSSSLVKNTDLRVAGDVDESLCSNSSVAKACKQVNDFPIVEPVQDPSKVFKIEPVIPDLVNYKQLLYPPAIVNWSGDFGFDIYFEPQEASKRFSWIYCQESDKLYVAKDKACNINFLTCTVVPLGSKIRVLAVFSMPEHCTEVASRCTNHFVTDMNAGIPAAEHLIRCESDQAVYEIDQETGIQSVVVPYEMPQRGQNYSTYIFKFVCFGSCRGGLNRRPIKVIFILEWQKRIIGQRSLAVKICASPSRDCRNDYKEIPVKESVPQEMAVEAIGLFPKKRRKTCDIDQVTRVKSSACSNASSVMVSEISSVTQVSSCPPATNNWPGDYGFNLHFWQRIDNSKESYVYSEARGKLYVLKDYPCGVCCTTERFVPEGTKIRIMPVFSLPQHANDIVQPCYDHTRADKEKGYAHAAHLIRCVNCTSDILPEYDVNPITSRQSCVVPFNNTCREPNAITYFLEFCCFGSCPGGLDRRPIKVVFTLENGNQVLGRRSLDVKICASPSRDCKNDDNSFATSVGITSLENTLPSQNNKKRSLEINNPADIFHTFNVMDTSDLVEGHKDLKNAYVITVDSKQKYDYLCNVNRLLDLKKWYNLYRREPDVCVNRIETATSDDTD